MGQKHKEAQQPNSSAKRRLEPSSESEADEPKRAKTKHGGKKEAGEEIEAEVAIWAAASAAASTLATGAVPMLPMLDLGSLESSALFSPFVPMPTVHDGPSVSQAAAAAVADALKAAAMDPKCTTPKGSTMGFKVSG